MNTHLWPSCFSRGPSWSFEDIRKFFWLCRRKGEDGAFGVCSLKWEVKPAASFCPLGP